MSGLRARCLIQLFPLCLVEESVSVGLVILSPPGKKCFWLMAILSFRASLVAVPAVEAMKVAIAKDWDQCSPCVLLSCSSLCQNICSLKRLAAKIAKFQIGIRKYRENVGGLGTVFYFSS